MSNPDLRALSRFSDSLSYAYLEHAVIEQEQHSIAAFTPDGRISLPAANLSCLLLGPGTRITHAAVKVLAECGTLVAWTGHDGLKFYASGQSKTRLSQGIELQARHWADPDLHLQVVRRMYQLRFSEHLSRQLTLQQIRGKEGVRVRDVYQKFARQYGVAWRGRSYDRNSWQTADPVNKALSAANAALYGVVSAGLHALGYSLSLGFIHTGKQLSFVYDVADLFKTETSIPAAFEAAAQTGVKVESRARSIFRDRAAHERLQDKLVKATASLFSDAKSSSQGNNVEVSEPADLWDPQGNQRGGVLHACDGA